MHNHSHPGSPREVLHEKGLKVTALREAMVGILQKAEKPLSVEELSAKLKKVSFDQASLFRSLKKFTEAGLVAQVDLGEGFQRYEWTCLFHQHHHHVICSGCKRIMVLPFCVPRQYEEYLRKAGYTQVTHRMDFFGLCPECSRAA
jgi:Fur family ferric uptake transcriptional regulator